MRNFIFPICLLVAACGGTGPRLVTIGKLPAPDLQVMCAYDAELDVIRLPADAPEPSPTSRMQLDLGKGRSLDLNSIQMGTYSSAALMVRMPNGNMRSLAELPDQAALSDQLITYFSCADEAARLG